MDKVNKFKTKVIRIRDKVIIKTKDKVEIKSNEKSIEDRILSYLIKHLNNI